MKNYLENQEPEGRETERSRFVRAINRISALSIPVLALTAGILIREAYLSMPVSTQYVNLNGDERTKDKIVTTIGGDILKYIQMPDGTYKPFSKAGSEAAKKEAKLKAYLENKVTFSDEDL